MTWLRMAIRIIVLVEVILGILFWLGTARGLTSLHVGLGFLLVLCMLALAGVALTRRAPIGLAALVVVWALVLPVVGFGQLHVVAPAARVVVQVVHLLLGLGAAGVSERLAARSLTTV
jgi:hypothetical protein